MSTKMVSPEDQLREYLAQDLALTKLRLNESQRSMGKLFYLVMLLVFLFIICIAGFACSVILCQKNTRNKLRPYLVLAWKSRRPSGRMENMSTKMVSPEALFSITATQFPAA